MWFFSSTLGGAHVLLLVLNKARLSNIRLLYIAELPGGVFSMLKPPQKPNIEAITPHCQTLSTSFTFSHTGAFSGCQVFWMCVVLFRIRCTVLSADGRLSPASSEALALAFSWQSVCTRINLADMSSVQRLKLNYRRSFKRFSWT